MCSARRWRISGRTRSSSSSSARPRTSTRSKSWSDLMACKSSAVRAGSVSAARLARGHGPRKSSSKRSDMATIHRDGELEVLDGKVAVVGCGRVGLLETTFAEETESDLFGEQAVLCGGVPALVQAGFDTLVAAGYQPEIAYYECLNELKLIVDLLYQGGYEYMRYSVSDVAEYGDLSRGIRVVDDSVRERMRGILEEIRSGAFAKELFGDDEAGRPKFAELRKRGEAESKEIERVGKELRELAGVEGLLGAEAHVGG